MTNDLNSYADLTLTSDSGTLAAVRSDRVVNLWLAPDGDASRARQITSGAAREDGIHGLSWTPDGKIVYCSDAGGQLNLWITATDGTGNKQLSPNARLNSQCVVSPDGRYIFWNVKQTGNVHIWRMEIDGSNPQQLTSGIGDFYPQISPDGKWIVYTDWDTFPQKLVLAKIPIEGGEPVQLTDKPFPKPIISPDGKLIAANIIDEASGQFNIAILPFDGGSPVKIFEILDSSSTRPLQWTPDGRAIAYIRTSNNVSNIWAQPLDGSPPKQLTDFKEQRIFNFAWSRDGKQLALSRGVVNSDVVLISGFK